jgi:predicted transglutaminase-like cysteine proteinase
MLTPPPRALRVWGGFWARPAPPQWDEFITRRPDQDTRDVETVAFLPDWLDLMAPIQSQCLALGHRREIRDIWDIADLDTLVPPQDGFDCEDHALTVRALAGRDLGIPLGALRLAVCETTETHAVLLVCTDQGELVVDNGHVWSEMGAWHEYPCKWLYVWGPEKWGRIMERDMRNLA